MPISFSGIKKNALIRSGYSHTKSVSQRVKDFTTPNLIKIPGAYFPHAGFTGSLWMEMTPKELKNISTGNRGGTFSLGVAGPTFKFLAPDDGIQEVHNHEWEEYESIYSRLLRLQVTFQNAKQQVGQVGSNIADRFGRLSNKITSGELDAGQIASSIQSLTTTTKPKRKVDVPLAYTNSPRRQFLFTFQLLSEGLSTDLVEVVKTLQSYASPGTAGGDVGISFHHVWSLQTDPRGILDVDIAACTSVQVTWQRPYRHGVPQKAELTLGFTDISPLFKGTIRAGSKVKVTGEGETDTRDFDEYRRSGNLSDELRNLRDRSRQVFQRGGYPEPPDIPRIS